MYFTGIYSHYTITNNDFPVELRCSPMVKTTLRLSPYKEIKSSRQNKMLLKIIYLRFIALL